MKLSFDFNNEASNNEVLDRFEAMEYIALTTDTRILRFIASFIKLQDAKARRSRTKAEREQRAQIYGFDSYKDVAK